MEKAAAGAIVQIVVNQTPFYAESGGQVGDAGIIRTDTGEARVTDTKKTAGVFFHVAEVTTGEIAVGQGARLAVDFVPGTRFPAGGTVTARDEAGGDYRIAIEAGPRFYLSGIGYMNPDWSHGLNKGPLAVGYDEIASCAGARHESRREHPQAFAKLSMTTPEGKVLGGQGCFESIVLGRHVPSGLTSMFDVP